VLTRKLRDLSRRAFENGVADPWARPSPEEWLIALLEAADQTALCPKCDATTYLPELRGTPFVCDWCGETSDRPIELGFFDVEAAINNLDEDERKELIRHKKPHRLVLDKQQRMIPNRLVSGNREETGDAGQFGAKPNSNNESIYGVRNWSKNNWVTKDAAGNKKTCLPEHYVWLFEQTVITFPSGIRAKVRNPYPHMGGQG
jgi:eukaryotic-like serine/threonine-protein kinase